MNNSEINLCLFDVDGLLLDTEKSVWVEAERYVLSNHGYHLSNEFLFGLIGIGFENYGPYMKKHVDPNFPTEQIKKELFIFFEKYVNEREIPKMKGCIELLSFLKNNNIKLAVGTSTKRKLSEQALKKAGIYDYFDYLVFGDEVINGKPDPEIYEKSIDALGIDKKNCVIFEDSQNGGQCAINGGIRLILVPDACKLNDEIKNKAFAVIESLDKGIDIIKKCNNIN